MDTELEQSGPQASKALDRPVNRSHNKNIGAMKCAARSQILEKLTAFKGGKFGKKGLLFKVLESLEADMDSPDPEIRLPARAEALKLAIAMTKDDKSTGLEDLLKAGSQVQINFNNYFEDRSNSDQPKPPAKLVHAQVLPDPDPD